MAKKSKGSKKQGSRKQDTDQVPDKPLPDEPPPESSPPDDDVDYTVGFGKPPLATRFKKGVSGNPKGPRPGSRKSKNPLKDELDRKVPITFQGRRIFLTKREILVRQLLAQAMRDPKLGLTVLLQDRAQSAGEAESAPPMEGLTAEERDLLRAYLARTPKTESDDAS